MKKIFNLPHSTYYLSSKLILSCYNVLTYDRGILLWKVLTPTLKTWSNSRRCDRIKSSSRVGIADSQGGLTQENFLRGEETQYLFDETLRFLGAERVSTRLVPLLDKPFKESVHDFFQRARRGNNALVFSGSPSTIKACEALADEFNLQIIQLLDDDQTGPRSRHIREGLLNEDDGWRNVVAPEVFGFLWQAHIIDRMKSLPQSGVKRPWANSLPAGAS